MNSPNHTWAARWLLQRHHSLHRGLMALCAACVVVGGTDSVRATPSTARLWNEQIINAIRIDRPNPPVHARNLFHLAVVMYDAWTAYDNVAIGYLHHERQTAVNVAAARSESISYAAYRLLRSRYAGSVGAATTIAALDAQLAALGYDKNITTNIGNTPAALGNRITADIISQGLLDGSNQQGGYTDFTYFNPQPPMIVLDDGVVQGGIPFGTDPNRWQPLALDAAVSQNGIPEPSQVQQYVGVTWLKTQPFSLTRTDASKPWINLGGPSKLGTPTDATYKSGAMDCLTKSALLSDPTLVEISPGYGGQGNNPLGTDLGNGRTLNPKTGLPYAPNLAKRSDFVRVLAEFWADGPDSETPPGHWHVLANYVTDLMGPVKRIGGPSGALVDDLEWDVKLYFALAGATHNAACAAWSNKRYYEGMRPITMIRYMGSKGQSSDPFGPSYHPEGLPLQAGVVEVITVASSAPGQRHAHLAAHVGKIAVFSWPGEPEDRVNQVNPVRWILATDWVPYQRKNFNTPAFPGYLSGHSTFSRAAAEVLTAFTGDEYFPGGLGEYVAPAGAYLVFEDGPSQTVKLQWATYYDAADQAGQSRRWGGIHPFEDDFAGRIVGSQCGISAWVQAQRFWSGTVLNETIASSLSMIAPSQMMVRWNTVRGLSYQVDRSTDCLSWEPLSVPAAALDTSSAYIDSGLLPAKRFYRVRRTTLP